MDLQGEKVTTAKRYVTDQDGTISKAQARRMFALAKGDADIVKAAIAEKGYKKTDEVKKTKYEGICSEIEKAVAEKAKDAEKVKDAEKEKPVKESPKKEEKPKKKDTPVDASTLTADEVRAIFENDNTPAQE